CVNRSNMTYNPYFPLHNRDPRDLDVGVAHARPAPSDALDSSAYPGSVHLLDRPQVIRTECFAGLDLGQVHDPTAIAVLECSEICIGRNLITYEGLIQKRSSFRHLERFPLGLDYPAIVERIRRLV